MTNTDPELIDSPLSRSFSRGGITVEVCIYRLEHDPNWVLEVVNEQGTSTVWEDFFQTDEEAYGAFLHAVATEGMVTFLDDDDTPEPKSLH